MGTLIIINLPGVGVICCLTSECSNLPCGEGATRMREPSSNYDRRLRDREERKRGVRIRIRVRRQKKLVGSYVGIREGSSFLCYIINRAGESVGIVDPHLAGVVIFLHYGWW